MLQDVLVIRTVIIQIVMFETLYAKTSIMCDLIACVSHGFVSYVRLWILAF